MVERAAEIDGAFVQVEIWGVSPTFEEERVKVTVVPGHSKGGSPLSNRLRRVPREGLRGLGPDEGQKGSHECGDQEGEKDSQNRSCNSGPFSTGPRRESHYLNRWEGFPNLLTNWPEDEEVEK